MRAAAGGGLGRRGWSPERAPSAAPVRGRGEGAGRARSRRARRWKSRTAAWLAGAGTPRLGAGTKLGVWQPALGEPLRKCRGLLGSSSGGRRRLREELPGDMLSPVQPRRETPPAACALRPGGASRKRTVTRAGSSVPGCARRLTLSRKALLSPAVVASKQRRGLRFPARSGYGEERFPGQGKAPCNA